MSGLDYSVDDLVPCSAAARVEAAVTKISSPVQENDLSGSACVMCGGKLQPAPPPMNDDYVICQACGLYTARYKVTGKVPPLLGDMTPENADKDKAEKLFVDTAQLDECIAQAENLQDVLHSESLALKVVGILSFGLRKSGELLASAIYDQKMAKSDLKRAQAIAALEEFHVYTVLQKDKGVDVKSTDTTRGHYININEGVLKAAEKEAFYEAVVSQLDSYKTQFTMVLSAVKAMIGKQRADSLISGVATPTAHLGNE